MENIESQKELKSNYIPIKQIQPQVLKAVYPLNFAKLCWWLNNIYGVFLIIRVIHANNRKFGIYRILLKINYLTLAVFLFWHITFLHQLKYFSVLFPLCLSVFLFLLSLSHTHIVYCFLNISQLFFRLLSDFLKGKF